MRRWAWIVGLLLLASACGGGGPGGRDAAGGLVVASADGIATLAIEPGSLPEGVTPEDLAVEAAFIESDDPAMPVVVVQLLPDGLVLEQPAALTVALPDASSAALIAIHVSRGSVEFLAGELASSGEQLDFTTEVAHFSQLVIVDFREAGFDPTLALNPKQVIQGESQSASATVSLGGTPVGAWVPFPTDPSGTARLVRFSAPIGQIDVASASVRWEELWDPSVRHIRGTQTDNRLDFDPVPARCTWPNESSVSLRATTKFIVEVLSVGEPVATAMLDFAERVSPEAGLPLATSDEPGPLLGVAPGRVVVMEVYVFVDEPTSCVDDLDAIAGSPEFSDCPIGYQLDIIGRLLSGKDGEQSELIAETPEAEGSNVACTKYNKRNPHVFALIVEGDGESLSTADNTSYQVRFVVNNEWPVNEYYDDTGFEVLVEWNRLAKQWVGVVRDQQGTRVGNDADVTIEWLDSSTLQVVVDVPGLDVEVTEMRTELNVYGTDDNDVFQFSNFDVAIWHKES